MHVNTESSSHEEVEKQVSTLTFSVGGMTCAACVHHVMNALNRLQKLSIPRSALERKLQPLNTKQAVLQRLIFEKRYLTPVILFESLRTRIFRYLVMRIKKSAQRKLDKPEIK